MVKLFSVNEMISLEEEANKSGLTYEEMMENAGRGIADEIASTYSHLHNKKIIALVGSGNNGGDALVALYYLSLQDWEVYAYVARKRDEKDPLIERIERNHGTIIHGETDNQHEKLTQLLDSCSVLIDGVFGTGIKLPLKGDVAKTLALVKEYIERTSGDLHVVAVDCPSGVDCDTGNVAIETIPAELTITMAGIKNGLVKFPAANMTGEIRVVSIGEIKNTRVWERNKKYILTRSEVSQFMPKRPLDAHKGTFGTAFIIAGSINFTGAALLAGLAAYRIGAGLVTLAVPASIQGSLAGRFPEATWVLLPDEMGVIAANAAKVARQNLDRATSVLIGPGFGLEATTREFLKRFFTTRAGEKKGEIGFIQDRNKFRKEHSMIPLVVDADGLKLLAKIENWTSLIPPLAILTPHPGEMSIMTGISIEDIQKNRIEIAMEYATKWGHVIVLKGAYTIIADPDGNLAIVPVATPALAKAGTGDVLAGIITGLRAQGVSSFNSACAGSWIHAQAGLQAAKTLGTSVSVLASDVLNAIPAVLSVLE